MNRNEARQILDDLVAAWPSVDMPANTLNLWIKTLGQYGVDSARAASEAVISSEKYFPTIARFREALTATARGDRFDWEADAGCPTCAGAGSVADAQGRDWLCRCATHARARAHAGDELPDPERMADFLISLRGLLSESGARSHWHGGPGPCPKCGGEPRLIVKTSMRPRAAHR